MNKAVGALFFLVAAGFGLFFFATVFHHGWEEGLIRLRHLRGEQLLYGLGMVAFAIASIVLFLRKRP